RDADPRRHRSGRDDELRAGAGRRARRAHRDPRYPPPFSRGSSRSRRPSPSMLKPKTASDSATAGQIASHGAWYMWSSPARESMPPHVGKGGGTPSPRNDRLASVRITVDSPV